MNIRRILPLLVLVLGSGFLISTVEIDPVSAQVTKEEKKAARRKRSGNRPRVIGPKRSQLDPAAGQLRKTNFDRKTNGSKINCETN